MEPVAVDTCEMGHKFAFLPDHPRKHGWKRCPHCMAENLDSQRNSIPVQQGALYMVDGKAHRMCACNSMDKNCPRGRTRNIVTAGYDCCMIPAPEMILVTG